MKRRISPLSSTRRSLRPGNCFSRLSIRPATVSAWPSTSAWPFVSERSGVGMRTSTGMDCLLRAGSAGGLGFEVRQRLVEDLERGADGHVYGQAVVEHVG